MAIRITIICENTVGPSLSVIGEHGFAAFLETPAGNFLFDTGQGISILHNARILKKDLNSTDKIFLSHGHYDHTGGLKYVLKPKGKAKVYAHPQIFEKKYACLKTNGAETERYIGMRQTRNFLEKLGAHFRLNACFTEVGADMYLTGEIPRITNFEKVDLRLLRNNNGKLVPDPVCDDQALVMSTKKGLVVILGCGHSGIINTIEYVLKHLKKEKLYALIGGTHLGFLKDDQLERTIIRLKQYDFNKIGVSHCTGLKAAVRLLQEFKDKFFFANVGASFEII
jgi:7,8-dihydropterin-6-yl-methyl-4-(beta-D-ribofuranosyl)aminobenzene 5'-phosphate synthase